MSNLTYIVILNCQALTMKIEHFIKFLFIIMYPYTTCGTIRLWAMYKKKT